MLDKQPLNVSGNDLSYTYSAYEFMIYYRGKPIGGAMVKPDKPYIGMAVRSNADYMKAHAQLEINLISEGRIDPYKRQAIEKIQAKEFHL